MNLDKLLHNIPGVRFFISAITALGASQGDDDDVIFPAVAYFIVYARSDVCNEEIIFSELHHEDTEGVVVSIKARKCGDGDSLARRIFNVVKDYNNPFVQQMVAGSNGDVIQRNLLRMGSPSFSPEHFSPEHFRTLPRELLLSTPNSAWKSFPRETI